MRLVDYYLEDLLSIRQIIGQLSDTDKLSADELKSKFISMISNAHTNAAAAGVTEEIRIKSLFPVAALIDELVLTSEWPEKSEWKNASLQRHYFNTTSAGTEFYERLNLLNRRGEDSDIREVFLICLGLGFKGKFFMPEDRPRIEEARGYNLSLLLPEDSHSRLDKTILFSQAYQKDMRENKLMRSRTNLLPIFTAIPFITVISMFVFYAAQIDNWISDIIGLVK